MLSSWTDEGDTDTKARAGKGLGFGLHLLEALAVKLQCTTSRLPTMQNVMRWDITRTLCVHRQPQAQCGQWPYDVSLGVMTVDL